jgi:hypothetical protein
VRPEPGLADRLVAQVRRWHPAALLAAVSVALSLVGPGERWPVAVAALAAVALSALLERQATAWAANAWPVPALLGAGAVAVLSGVSLPAELLAAATGLSALYWIGSDRRWLSAERGAAAGLVLPALAVALAISVTLFLPAGPALVGVAGAILVGLFLGLAAVLASWSGEEGAAVAPSHEAARP